VRGLLEDLPPGDPDRIRRPQGPPSEWPRPTWAEQAESSVA